MPRRREREVPDLSQSSLVYIGQGHYVDPSTGMVLSRLGFLNAFGYERMYRGGREVYLHRVLWEALHGPIPKGLTINHLNGVRDDNRISNLELATQQEQLLHTWRVLDGFRNRKNPSGLEHHNSKLTPEKVARLRTPGVNISALAREFGVTSAAAHKAATGGTWRELDDIYPPSPRRLSNHSPGDNGRRAPRLAPGSDS